MNKTKPITIPGLVKALGAVPIADALQCDRGLPNKWARGQRPGWRNLDQLAALAAKHGYTLTPPIHTLTRSKA